MKNKLVLAVIGAVFCLTSSVAFAEMNSGSNAGGEKKWEARQEENFAKHKQQMLTDLADQKTAIDQTISCVNSAKATPDIKKCHEIREAAMQKIQQRNLANRREELQNELKRLDEKEQNLKNRQNSSAKN